MFKIVFYTITISLLLVNFNVAANEKKQVDTINFPWIPGNVSTDYYYLLLTLALENSKDRFGEFNLVRTSIPMYQQRAVSEVRSNSGLLDIMWTMTSIKREKVLAPIRIPLFRGLGGYRIALIHKDSLNKFEQIKTEEDLQKLLAGQGTYWPDSKILADQNYQLTTAIGHEILFNMLKYKRFDYMPRGIYEIWAEANNLPDLIVEPNFALYYPSPFYFFVNRNNTRLINRLTYGLNMAEKNGSFKKLFDNHPLTKGIISKANLADRTIFYLDNNFMSKATQNVIKNTAVIIKD